MTHTLEVKVVPKADHSDRSEAQSEAAGRRSETGSEATPIWASGQTTTKLLWSRTRRR